ncbi:DUF4065 domain-containing protein [Pseudomonas sp. ITA]|uniref:Panacea domain-containing protein n=1 Tax=Pseudomonas sp. ITA TaxID=2825841 RepID=UPI0024965E51|nr:type II toxin-antitoxin system antitoxin SocA domain-containing protein [Pseudomonas sp. ITA]MDI2145899.1 DUF4065 domain-containing protein [Pseudomonas sp. ITA]
MFTAKSVANYLLELADKSDQPMSSAKLQALVYYAHGWHAAHTGRALINEKIQAGPYGLLIPSLYREFSRFGSRPINRKALEYDALGANEAATPRHKDTLMLLQAVFRNYASCSDTQLADMTNGAGSPWETTWRESKGMRGVNIPFSRITAYFKSVLQATPQSPPIEYKGMH